MPSGHEASQYLYPRFTQRRKIFFRHLLKYIDDRVEGNAVLEFSSPGREGPRAVETNSPNSLIDDPRLADTRFSHHND